MMATIEIFREMSGLADSSVLELSPSRIEEIVDKLSNWVPQPPAKEQTVQIATVSTYVVDYKCKDAGFMCTAPPVTLPAYACHWGVIVEGWVGEIPSQTLYHLVLHDGRDIDDGVRRAEFHFVSYPLINAKGTVTRAGTTRYGHLELDALGKAMIKEFGDYHLVFWNCQIFAECYLRVITGSNAGFSQSSLAQVANIFLCALVIPAPFVSTRSRIARQRKDRLVQATQRAVTAVSVDETPTREQVYKLSDRIIDGLFDTCIHDAKLQQQPTPIENSGEKLSILEKIASLMGIVVRRDGK